MASHCRTAIATRSHLVFQGAVILGGTKVRGAFARKEIKAECLLELVFMHLKP